MRPSILYLGDSSGTSLHRANAFRRMGYNITHISPRQLLPRSKWIDRIEWHVSPRLLSRFICARLMQHPALVQAEVVWVDNGSLISAELVEGIRKRGKKIISFNHDDPYGSRDEIRFEEYRRAVCCYDLVVVVRQQNVEEAKNFGARNVLLVKRTADEVAHAPRPINASILENWRSEVAFVGTWMPERGPFLRKLIRLGVPLSIYGSGWQKDKEWCDLKPFHRRGHLDGNEYAYAIQCSKVSIGLLSKGNRDLHTTRSLEIPMLGAILCAERTSEHLSMYIDELEAVFWNDAEECAEKCMKLLRQPNVLASIAVAGRSRVMRSGNTSEALIQNVFRALKKLS